MEETPNLLDDYVSHEPDLQDFHAEYHSVRRIARTIFGLAYLLYLIFVNPWRYDENGFNDSLGIIIGTMIGSAFGLMLGAAIPAALFASLFAFLGKKKYPYKDRFAKIYWWLLLGMAILFLGVFGTVALQNHFIPFRK